jgi:hypothetical protein
MPTIGLPSGVFSIPSGSLHVPVQTSPSIPNDMQVRTATHPFLGAWLSTSIRQCLFVEIVSG